MATIRIKVVAAADSSLSTVFVPLTTASKQAKKKVGEDLAGAATEGGAAIRNLPVLAKPAFENLGMLAAGASKRFRDLELSLKGMPAELRTVAQEAQRELQKIERDKARMALGLTKPAVSIADQEWAKEIDRRARRQARTAMGIGQSTDARGIATDSSPGWFPSPLGIAARLASGAAGLGIRVAGDLARGIGVNTDLTSMFAQQTSLETMATQLSASGYIRDDARNGRRVDAGALVREARQVGIETGTDPTQALAGLQAFTGKTGDLATGRAAMKDLSVLAKATGTNLEDMVSAAGDVSNVLGDVPDKGKAVYEVMKMIAGQGKLGAVEIKDLASQMAKVAAGAQLFAGDRARNIAVLGAIAQEARGTGGSASATQAATSVSSFVNTFSKSARVAAFKGFGVKIQDEGGLRDAQAIITDALNAAMRGGNRVSAGGKVKHVGGGTENFSENLGAMFMDVRARSAVRGFEAIYQQSYAGAQGTEQQKMAEATAAVTAEFERLQSAAMSEKEVQASFARAMDTTESKVTTFNGVMAALAGDVQGPLTEALMGLRPVAIDLATGFKDMISWLVQKGLIKDASKEQALAHAREAIEAGGKAVDVAGKVPTREIALTGERVPLSSVSLPEGALQGVSESRGVLERTLEEAKKKEGDIRKQYGKSGFQTDEELHKIYDVGPDGQAAEYGRARDILNAEANVDKAQKEVDRAAEIEAGMKAALASGRLVVVIDEDRTKRNAVPTVDEGAQMPAEATP